MWQQPVSILAYLLVAAVVVFLSIFLSIFVDLLDKKTNVSGAFLGSILLAATTSLPELFTSLTASLLVNNNALVYGDILGSNLFNVTLKRVNICGRCYSSVSCMLEHISPPLFLISITSYGVGSIR